ncbi:MAG: hypothetical protein V1744_04860 [Candidatus Altiarchaeota archaeon]
MECKAQASLEYMIMLGLSLMVFSAVLYVTSVLITASSVQVGVDSAFRAIDRMKGAADFIYVHGHPSRTEINVYIPPNIENLTIRDTNNSICASVSVGENYTDIYGVTKGKIYGDLSAVTKEGYYVFRVESTSDDAINITVV